VDLRDYMRVLRRRWRLVALCVFLSIAGAAAVVLTVTPQYTATTQLYVAAKNGNVTDLATGTSASQQLVQSYAQIITNPTVTGVVSNRLHDGRTAIEISHEVTASAPLNTQLLDVSVTDPSPTQAAAIANTLSNYFALYAANLQAHKKLNSPVQVTVVRHADVPTSPSSPRKALDLAIGLVIGLVVGVGGAVLRETLDRTVTTPDQIHELLDLPVLGAIALDPDAANRPLVVSGNPRSTRAEAFRQLRTNLRFIDPDSHPRSLAITSSVPSEGKTTTAVNLAITLADAGQRVVLVEGDLRRPKAADYLGLEGAVGLTDVLVGAVPLRDALQSWGARRQLQFLASGALPPNPSELLASQGMHELLRVLEEHFDMVLIDSPPLLPVTDGALLANAASGALVVLRHGKTRREQVARAVDSLRAADATVYGVVLTFTPTRGPDAYYYGYGYRYDPTRGRHRGESASGPSTVAPPVPAIEAAEPVPSPPPSTLDLDRPAPDAARPRKSAGRAGGTRRTNGHAQEPTTAAVEGSEPRPRPTILPNGDDRSPNGGRQALERLRAASGEAAPPRRRSSSDG